jgi:hypothetical protein
MNAKGLFRWIALPALLVILFVGNLSIGSVPIPVADIAAIISVEKARIQYGKASSGNSGYQKR